MQQLGTFGGKQVLYTNNILSEAGLNEKNWMAFIVTAAFSARTQGDTLAHIVTMDPLFILCCCPNSSDMEDAAADLLCEKFPGFDDDTVMPMTYADTDLEQALHFAAFDAFHEEKEIEEIVVIDLDESPGIAEKLKTLLAGS